MSRTGLGVTASRTFDLEINLRGGSGPNYSHTFGSIDREEQEPLENYCIEKGIRVKNEEKIAKAMMVKAIKEANDDDDDDDVDMGSAGDDDDESADDDFNSGSDSDVAEEFDSDAAQSSDEEMDEGKGESEAKKDDRPPTKKVKN